MKKAYLKNGKTINVVSTITDDETGDTKYLVSDFIYMYDNYGECYEEPSEEGMYFVYEIFEKPPTEILDKRVIELNKEIEELNSKKFGIEKSIRDLMNIEKEIQEKTSRISALENIFDFIDGKITHYVTKSYSGIKIIKFNDTKSEYSDYKKLLTLFGNSKGDLSWKLNRYSDGSGSDEIVIPCTSYEMAIEKAQSFVDATYQEFLTEEYSPSKYLILSAKKLGLKIPEDYINKYTDDWKKSNSKNISKLKEQLKERQEEKVDI